MTAIKQKLVDLASSVLDEFDKMEADTAGYKKRLDCINAALAKDGSGSWNAIDRIMYLVSQHQSDEKEIQRLNNELNSRRSEKTIEDRDDYIRKLQRELQNELDSTHKNADLLNRLVIDLRNQLAKAEIERDSLLKSIEDPERIALDDKLHQSAIYGRDAVISGQQETIKRLETELAGCRNAEKAALELANLRRNEISGRDVVIHDLRRTLEGVEKSKKDLAKLVEERNEELRQIVAYYSTTCAVDYKEILRLQKEIKERK